MKTKNYLFSALLVLGACIIVTSSCKKDDSLETETGTVTDTDGNVYKTVKIGTQTWMAENLKTTKYRNGDAIPEVTDNTLWGDLSTGAYCNYDNSAVNVATYGRLYNWYAVIDSRNIAPEGWHVPTDNDWDVLISNLEGSTAAGGKLKENGTTHWTSPNTGATNETSFTALAGGVHGSNGYFGDILNNGAWWTSTAETAEKAYCRVMYYDNAGTGKASNNKVIGFSVRCVKD